ncbi:MAG: DUF3299 domain-containing protein [bacterium]|nr:DUF3299 domain-containing protein [bacterium]
MRRRAKRDLLTLAGVAIVVGAVVVVNGYLRLETAKEFAIKMRMALEKTWKEKGVEVLDWDTLKETKGTYRSGPTFKEGMTSLEGKAVNICGFMAPIDQFRNVTEFMLLPMPITCYFCESPPMRHVIEVKLDKPTELINEPVLIGGWLKLHEGDKQPFFYTIEKAKWNEAVQDEPTTDQVLDEAHQQHHIKGFDDLRKGGAEEEELLEPVDLEAQEEAPSVVDDLMPGLTEKKTHAGIPIVERGELQAPESVDEDDGGS